MSPPAMMKKGTRSRVSEFKPKKEMGRRNSKLKPWTAIRNNTAAMKQNGMDLQGKEHEEDDEVSDDVHGWLRRPGGMVTGARPRA